MAVKPITDRQLIDQTTVNRETQTSQRNMNTRGDGNESQTINHYHNQNLKKLMVMLLKI